MKGSIPLSVGGLVGSFSAVCAMSLGVPRLDFLLFSLFFVSISSFVALIAEDQAIQYASAGVRSNLKAYKEIELLQSLARACFGASLAAAALCSLTQASIKISLVFSVDIVTAGFVSTVFFVGYVSIIVLLLTVGQDETTS